MNYDSLKEGEIDSALNKRVRKMVINHQNFVVYLDDDLDTQWHVREDVENPIQFGRVLNAVASVELRSDFLRDDERTFMRVRVLAGEALARAIDDRDEVAAMGAIEHAEAIIAKRGAELSRRWYYSAALSLVLAQVLFAVFAWVTRNFVPWDQIIGRTAFHFIFCAVAGAIGALVSIIIRSHAIELDAMSGPLAHQMESRARIVTGMVAAVAFGLATKLGWLSVFHGDPQSLTFLALLGLIAGASERAVPNIVSRFDPLDSQKKSSKIDEEDGVRETRQT